MNRPDVSVIIITYNGIRFIENCVSSVLSSCERMSAEIVVVDNCSVDSTVALVEQKFPAVKIIKNAANYGFARAANQGFEDSKGEFILLLNQDTRVEGNAIPNLVSRLKENPRIGIIGPKFIGFDGKLQWSCRAFPRYRDVFYELTGLSYIFSHSRIFSYWKMGWFDHETEMSVDQPMGAAMMFRRTLLKRIGALDESFPIFFNDVDFCRRAMDHGYINLYFPAAVVEHYIGGTTRKMKPKMILESHRSMFRYFRKYNKTILSTPGLYLTGLALFISGLFRAGYHILFRRSAGV